MNWPDFALNLSKAVMYTTIGIQQVHGDAIAGADKKSLALESLGLAAAVAQGTLPQYNDETNAAAKAASGLIDVFANLFKDTGWFKSKISTPQSPVTNTTAGGVVGIKN